ncbi:hypothetical protein BCR44DRAFT_1426210 [Catenaria anguillulae PL171]|uniref:Uncharacterized protein n=1 Tax=Catenaria anguillulae PL171 TaxID=765915 RepID=A0A1Y2I010_9FUNG|nr:hypothetical protein BCR44DRAFT_1426210 [Catenaria anguillulae PL171]
MDMPQGLPSRIATIGAAPCVASAACTLAMTASGVPNRSSVSPTMTLGATMVYPRVASNESGAPATLAALGARKARENFGPLPGTRRDRTNSAPMRSARWSGKLRNAASAECDTPMDPMAIPGTLRSALPNAGPNLAALAPTNLSPATNQPAGTFSATKSLTSAGVYSDPASTMAIRTSPGRAHVLTTGGWAGHAPHAVGHVPHVNLRVSHASAWVALRRSTGCAGHVRLASGVVYFASLRARSATSAGGSVRPGHSNGGRVQAVRERMRSGAERGAKGVHAPLVCAAGVHLPEAQQVDAGHSKENVQDFGGCGSVELLFSGAPGVGVGRAEAVEVDVWRLGGVGTAVGMAVMSADVGRPRLASMMMAASESMMLSSTSISFCVGTPVPVGVARVDEERDDVEAVPKVTEVDDLTVSDDETTDDVELAEVVARGVGTMTGMTTDGDGDAGSWAMGRRVRTTTATDVATGKGWRVMGAMDTLSSSLGEGTRSPFRTGRVLVLVTGEAGAGTGSGRARTQAVGLGAAAMKEAVLTAIEDEASLPLPLPVREPLVPACCSLLEEPCWEK